MYIAAITRDFAKSLSSDDAHALLEQGDVWRNAALAAIYKLERPISDDTAAKLRDLDRRLLKDPKIGETETAFAHRHHRDVGVVPKTKNPVITFANFGVPNRNGATSSRWHFRFIPKARTGTT